MTVLSLSLSACGDQTEQLAADVCDLARGIASGDTGMIAAGMEANSIRKEAKDNDISLSDLLAAAQKECPEVADDLPF